MDCGLCSVYVSCRQNFCHAGVKPGDDGLTGYFLICRLPGSPSAGTCVDSGRGRRCSQAAYPSRCADLGRPIAVIYGTHPIDSTRLTSSSPFPSVNTI
ncbi:unnamed protein product [Macrosiphum euphorbiae]|uniref:Uncharacterized protein n=1 Tax=Macrosiphum euphorbiae TaxID=13131 RepID=A0AAV0X6N7_9HEMI|nr:unnamed protein product [Macrosiphum euphorbiae]